MNQTAATPKDASAVILLNQDLSRVLWARRNPKLAFLGGWHAFPGGKFEPSDARIEIENARGGEFEKYIATAARECFEETGVLLARGGEKLTRGQRASLHDDLVSARSTFGEILHDWNLRLDARDFFYTGFWTTPQFSPVRFKTRFFIAVCPPKQNAYAAITELRDVEFIEPHKALERWSRGEVIISPPVLISLQELAKTKITDLENPARILLSKSEKLDGEIRHIEFNPRIICFPLKTDTLPPATHTNCFIVGRREFVVIDAASRDETEQRKLFELVDSLIEKGCLCREIVVSHLHADHFGGETALKKHLREKFAFEVPLSAHETTAASLAGVVAIDRFMRDEEIFRLKDAAGEPFGLKALHTPGHARGHLCFYDEEKGFLLSSDNVVGLGTVLVAPPEGDMSDYLASLEKMKNLPNLRFLCGSHGAAVAGARAKIDEYIRHRLEREKQILDAFQSGARGVSEIAAVVYRDLAPALAALAEKSVEAHLLKLKRDGSIAA